MTAGIAAQAKDAEGARKLIAFFGQRKNRPGLECKRHEAGAGEELICELSIRRRASADVS